MISDQAAATTVEENALLEIIWQEIRHSGGRIAFARFMELALYQPEYGYYLGSRRKPGRAGDFITAPEATPYFGHTLARQIAELWERLACPDRWSIREYGAGIGGLAYDIMAALATNHVEAFSGLTYRLVEPNRFALQEAHRSMSEVGLGERILIEDAIDTLEPITGVVLANEVVDAMPVHRLTRRGSGWTEGYVSVEGRTGALVWVYGPVSEAASPYLEYLASTGVDFREGDIIDASPAAAAWFERTVLGIDRGYAMIIDYGYQADMLYSGHRLEGTLRAYRAHSVADTVLANPGNQDLTAHVDFTFLQLAGESAGLIYAGFITQAEFLTNLGLGNVMMELQSDPSTTIEEYLTTQAVILRLIDPGGLGRFGVLGMAKGAPVDPALSGFRPVQAGL